MLHLKENINNPGKIKTSSNEIVLSGAESLTDFNIDLLQAAFPSHKETNLFIVRQ